LNIAHLSHGTDIGGLEQMLLSLARHRDQDRFQLDVISLIDKGPIAQRIEREGVPVTSLIKRDGIRPRIVFQIARHLKRRRISVLHTHNAAGLMYGVPAAILAGAKRVIHTRHGPRVSAGKWGLRAITRLSRRVNRYVAVSDHARRLAVAEGIRAACTCVIENGVDTSMFAYQEPNPRGPIVCVSRLSPEKNVDVLIRALGILRNRGAEQQCVIVGDGPLRRPLGLLACELGLGQTVRLVGAATDVRPWLAQGSMFVLPSANEGQSLTILEALATGLPVIATRSGGNIEILTHEQTGLLTEPDSPEELAQAILRIRSHAEPARQMGRAGRALVELRFDIRSVVAKYEQLYRGLEPDVASPCEQGPATSASI
jgi:glycosyltransferase involved in cell wall biosynthesis